MAVIRRLTSPVDERPIASVEELDLEATDAAIKRAAAAAPGWAAVSPGDRARLLHRAAGAVDGALEELARLEVANAGHTISNARLEAANVRDVLAYYAGAP